MPNPEEATHKFVNWQNAVSPSHVVYADFESLLEPVDGDVHQVQQRDVAHHTPSAAGYIVVPRQAEMSGPALRAPNDALRIFRESNDEKCLENFLADLENTARDVYFWNKRWSFQKARLSPAQWTQHRSSTQCYLCRRAFTSEFPKHLDHDPLDGSAACSECNTRLRLKRRVLQVFFHNFRG